MTYQLKKLTKELLFITYDAPPGRTEGFQMIEESRQIVEASPQPMYVLVDSRSGPIRDMALQSQLAVLTANDNVGFVAVFGFDNLSNLFANIFTKLDRKKHAGFYKKASDALNKLKSIKPDILDSVDKAFLESLQS